MTREPDYVPALRFHALTGLYDRVMAATNRERRFKRALLERLELPAHGTLLDLGCGTGTMTLWARAAWPQARIIGVDADPAALEIAGDKQSEAGVEIDFRRADARALPLETSSVDAVTCSLFFHHLADSDKNAVLAEIRRALRPRGQLLIADWGRPRSALTAAGFFLVRCLDGFERTRSNARGRLPEMIARAGFSGVAEFDRVPTMFGEIQLLSALRPESANAVSAGQGATPDRG